MQKKSKQQVTEKDRLVEFFGRTLTLVKANNGKVILGVSGGVLLLAIISGLGLYNRKADREASLAFQAVKADFQAVVERDGRDTALTRWLGDAPTVLGGMEGRASSYEAALLWYGGLAFETRDFESASQWYGAAAKAFSADSSLRNIAWCGQGQALEQQGKLAEAAPVYEKVRKSGSSAKHAEATFHLARIKDVQGDAKAAEMLYREIMDSALASPYKPLAAEKVAGL